MKSKSIGFFLCVCLLFLVFKIGFLIYTLAVTFKYKVVVQNKAKNYKTLLLQAILIQKCVLFLNSSLVELQFLPQLKPIEIITQQHGQS